MFFKNSKTLEGGQIVRLLSDEATKIAFKNSIDNNLSDVAKARETEQVFLALEAFLEPIIGKALLGLSENLNAVEENNPECLHEIVKDSILAITDHFKKLRAVALSHNVANAYDLTQSQLMKGMTLDGVARKYVFLDAKVTKAQKKRDAAESKLKQWRMLGLSKDERLSFELEKANAELELKTAKEIAEAYVAKNWPDDNGVSMKNYLSYERALTAARSQVTFAEKRRSEWFTDQENIECEIQASHQEFNRIERELRDARYELKNQIVDPFSCPIYIQFLEKLEGDLTPDNRIEVQNEMNKYTVGLFKPLADDLLSLINVDQFDEIPFLGLLGEELKKNKVQEIKDKLPEILHQIFETVGEPTTFLSLFNSILEGQSSSENVPVKDVEEADDYSDENDDFDIIGGQVVMEAIKLMPSRVEEALFMITKVKGATQEAAGKAVGAKLRKFLKTQTLPNLFNTILKSSVTAVLPKATWSDTGELIFGNEAKMPQTAAELKRVETAKQLEAQQLFYKVKNGFAALSEQVIKDAIQDKINGACKSVNNVTSAVIKTILNEQRAEKVISALSAFTNFIYKIIASLIRVIAMPFWAVVRLLILAPKSAQITKAIGSSGHKRLVFQLPVLFLEIIKRERQKLEQKRAEAALESESEKEVLIESEDEVSEVLFEV
jgi:hypothetical protein